MAYKVFQNGFPLNASELNNYLMNQSVMVFASTTARDADLTAPVEGMIVWLQDSNKFVYYTGSAWTDVIVPPPTGNAIINGDFNINQRSFSSGTSTAYGFDRWVNNTDGVGATFTAQTFTPGTAPVAGYEAKNFLQVATTGQTSTSTFTIFTQRIEDVRTFAGQTVTISFWAKAASGTPKIGVELNQYFSGGSADVSIPVSAVTLTTSWARYSVSVAVPAMTGKTIGNGGGYIELNLWTSAGSSFASRASSIGIQTATIAVWGAQVEAGSVVSNFKRNASSIEGELAACQRYYYRVTASVAYGYLAGGLALTGTTANTQFTAPVTMRSVPTAVDYPTLSTIRYAAYNNANPLTGITLNSNSSQQQLVIDWTTSGGLTAGNYVALQGNNSAAAYVGFSAEL